MKKTGLIAALALATIFALSSCKKDYTCTCTIKTTVSGTTTTTTTSGTINASKSDAKDACNQGDGTETFYSETIVTDCEISD